MGLLSRQPWIIALLITIAIAAWMASGVIAQDADDAAVAADTAGENSTLQQDQASTAPLPRVQVTEFTAIPVSREVGLYGRTEPDRKVTLRSETRGRVVEVLVERGALVKKGQAVARLALNDRRQQLEQAKALLRQRELEYDGTKKLKQQGYQAETRLAEKEAQLKDARARVLAMEIDLANTVIKAPFSGVLNERHVEVGDYLRDGDEVAEIVDVDPLVVRADVTETNVTELELGQSASVRFIDGSRATGSLRYISQVADTSSNTFRIEVAIPNTNSERLAGMSAELALPVATENAIKISPALLALDEDGSLGIKQVVDGKVLFTAAKLLKSEPDGIWLAGLGQAPQVITLGAGFVRHGDAVEAVFAEDEADAGAKTAGGGE